MSYSCTYFTDTIIDALGVEIPERSYESPSDQADLCLEEIERLKAFEDVAHELIYGGGTVESLRRSIALARTAYGLHCEKYVVHVVRRHEAGDWRVYPKSTDSGAIHECVGQFKRAAQARAFARKMNRRSEDQR
jgi:hypothetical protein